MQKVRRAQAALHSSNATQEMQRGSAGHADVIFQTILTLWLGSKAIWSSPRADKHNLRAHRLNYTLLAWNDVSPLQATHPS